MRISTDPYPVATLPAGEYYVGDPCYVFPDGEWEDWVARAESGDTEELYAAEVDGHPVAACGFVRGVGDVTDQDGFDYVEDSGLIAAVPVELAELDEYSDDSMRRVSFPEEFEVYASTTMIRIGHLRIDVSEDFDDREDEMDDVADAPVTVPAYELRAVKMDSTWVVPRRKFYRRELGLDVEDLDSRIAEGRFDDELSPPIRMRRAQAGSEGDLLWTKGLRRQGCVQAAGRRTHRGRHDRLLDVRHRRTGHRPGRSLRRVRRPPCARRDGRVRTVSQRADAELHGEPASDGRPGGRRRDRLPGDPLRLTPRVPNTRDPAA